MLLTQRTTTAKAQTRVKGGRVVLLLAEALVAVPGGMARVIRLAAGLRSISNI